MGRVFVTGDTHDKDEYKKIERLCEIAETNKDDFIIILDFEFRIYIRLSQQTLSITHRVRSLSLLLSYREKLSIR